MIETPKCPYCGAETRLNERNTGIYWYECQECNATGPTEKTPVEAFSAALHRADPDTICQQLSKALCGKGNATLEEMLEAVEQLKQRAEPEMRPLTLEEILAKANEEDWNFVWLEYNLISTTLQILPHNISKTYFHYLLPGSEEDYRKEPFIEINKTWRCWPRKPTPEQMAAEKWEE